MSIFDTSVFAVFVCISVLTFVILERCIEKRFGADIANQLQTQFICAVIAFSTPSALASILLFILKLIIENSFAQ